MKKMLRIKEIKETLRLFTLLVTGLLMQQAVSAQVPQTFNYQGIARDAGGNVLPNRKIGVELSVLDGGLTGTVVYAETFTDTTNAFGLFSMQVGGGTVVSGSFAGINWATGNKYLQTSIDLSGGTSYTLSGTTQLLSVPYALYAQQAVVPIGGAWKTDGNTSIGDSNFIGTNNDAPLIFKTNGKFSGIIDPDSGNTYFGFLAAQANTLTIPTLVGGRENTGIGLLALDGNSGGSDNTAVGANSLAENNFGSGNVAIGGQNDSIRRFTLGTNVNGNFNTAVGTGADITQDGITNSTALGAGALVDASNKVRIGNAAITVIEGQVPFTTPSDGRFKFNVTEDVKGLDFILKLRPVTYQFNTKKQEDFVRGLPVKSDAMPVVYNEAMMVRRTGFIAQEVERAAKMTGYDFDGLRAPKTEREYYSLSYASFVVPLVKAVQEQEGVIRRQEQRIDDLTKQVKELRELILAATKK